MQWLYKLLFNQFGVPLINKGLRFIKNWVISYLENKRLKKENDAKTEEYKKADDVDSARDAFSKLP